LHKVPHQVNTRTRTVYVLLGVDASQKCKQTVSSSYHSHAQLLGIWSKLKKKEVELSAESSVAFINIVNP